MPMPFDSTLKELVESYPHDWLAQLALPASLPVDVIDADLSTITTQADKVLRVHEAIPWLLHLELQASRDLDLVRRAHRYNVLLHYRHDLPVHSVRVLLRREADDPALTADGAALSSGGGSPTASRSSSDEGILYLPGDP